MSLVHSEFFGVTKDGWGVSRFTLSNKNGLAVRFINYGCRLTNIFTRDRDILLGFDSLAGYEDDGDFHGALVGRYANRIKNGTFRLSGHGCSLPVRGDGNYLHGSFHKRVFDLYETQESGIMFRALSPDGEDGFPGAVDLRVLYTLDEENRFTMCYTASSDADTHINLTNHSYFDLSAGEEDNVEGHFLMINSRGFLEAGADLCPTGNIIETSGGPFDFSEAKLIGRDIDSRNVQLELAGGFDHCFLLENTSGALSLAAEASNNARSCVMRVYTTQPAMQLYTGNFLNGQTYGKGRRLSRRSGFCLETQHCPDSPNRPEFPSTLLRPGEEYSETTVLQFYF